jgi:3-oxoacyl-(acyl-carrier-protein) synthase/3-hydroxymyristoyl/3-hydroxydecanoyl-(acyl carrier protein) dehydratase
MKAEAIAIVGMAVRLPGAQDQLSRYWQAIVQGTDCSSDVPTHRWMLPPESCYDPQPGQSDRVYCRRGYFLEPFVPDLQGLDIDPPWVAQLDPLVQLVLDVGARAWRSAQLEGVDRRRVGVVLGNICLPTEGSSALCRSLLGQSLGLASGSVLTEHRRVAGFPAALLAQALHLGGGGYALDAACASSLYALSLAVEALQAGQTDAMLAGGCCRPDCQYTQMGFAQLRALSLSGRCAPFDAAADGLLVGEGAALFVLKRLRDAIRDGDTIHAVIRGIGLSNDRTGSLLAPAQEGQLRAMRRAYEQAGCSPQEVDYIECHATGTPIGDAVEFASLRQLWEGGAWRAGQCVLSSVKATVGHLLTGAGAAALAKVLLALKHRQLPPQANFTHPSPQLAYADGPFRILQAAEPWDRPRQRPRRVAVSAFGFGGINAHVVLEEWEGDAPSSVGCTSTPRRMIPVAIVGLASHFGPLQGPASLLTALRHSEPPIARPKYHGWGWSPQPCPPARAIEELEFPTDRFRIPPREVEETLPQQLLMLQLADQAIEDYRAGREVEQTGQSEDTRSAIDPSVFPRELTADLAVPARTSGRLLESLSDAGQRMMSSPPSVTPPTRPSLLGGARPGEERWGVFIGLELDPNTMNFHLRWSALAAGRKELAEQISPPLNANRTMGALGSITASRIARAWGVGGPAYTVCNEEASGLRAVMTAWQALDSGAIDLAIVGAIDLAVDPRTVIPAGLEQPGEGAAAFVLKRLTDAQRDGDAIYAVIQGAGCGWNEQSALEEALTQAGWTPDPRNQLPRVQATALTGQCGAATAAADLACATLLLSAAESSLLSRWFASSSHTVGDQAIGHPTLRRCYVTASSCTTHLALVLEEYAPRRSVRPLFPLPRSARSLRLPVGLPPPRTVSATVSASVVDAAQPTSTFPPSVTPMTSPADTSPPALTTIPSPSPLPLLASSSQMQTATSPMETASGLATAKPARWLPEHEQEGARFSPAVTSSLRNTPVSADTVGLVVPVSLLAAYGRTQEEWLAAQSAFLQTQQRWFHLAARLMECHQALLARCPPPSEWLDVAALAKESGVSNQAEADRGVQLPPDDAARPMISPEGDIPRSLNYEQCCRFAAGQISEVLGPRYALIDTFPTRVRLPDGPLQLVDRIVQIEGEPLSLQPGRVVTEHTVHERRWYLEGNRMPTALSVEAGQADLFLSGFLGIDLQTRGEAVYRLLDAEVTFHRGLPQVGETIRYDIAIDEFVQQGGAWLFRFRFEGRISGQPYITMRHGTAGFFTPAALSAGKGIVQTALARQVRPGKRPADWQDLAPLESVSLDEHQLAALRRGEVAAAFGPAFAHLGLRQPRTLPDGPLRLLDRVPLIDLRGGRFGLGLIRGELDIHPDDWFLTCHFVDDPVMPGTLMYECCLQTLRVGLLRLGWIGEADEVMYEPVPGVASRLKCRGQVIPSTRTTTYEVTIKELGYRPQPYCLADALMYADGKPIVEILNLSLQVSGLTREELEQRWQHSRRSFGERTISQSLPKATPTTTSVPSPITPPSGATVPLPKAHEAPRLLYDSRHILAFSNGKPSEAFGEPYRIFDSDRIIARLPGPPYQFLDGITAVEGKPFVLQAGASCQAIYDVPPSAWYFQEQHSDRMPFCVLLEIALQPCGWLAAYCGSALLSDEDLSFRNLGGSAIQHRPVTRRSGRLTTHVRLTQTARAAGMIIEHFAFQVWDSIGPVYEGTTYFGFFTKAALQEQVGLRDVTATTVEPPRGKEGEREPFPVQPPFPGRQLRMIDWIETYQADGGRQGLGRVVGSIAVDPSAWFFQAHFYQDPVWPGSLGLQSFLQLLQYLAWQRWGEERTAAILPTEGDWQAPALGRRHQWTYRGQIVPTHQRVTVEAEIVAIDDRQRCLTADGLLWVDGRPIYRMQHFTLQWPSGT